MSVTLLQKYQQTAGQVPTAAQVKQRELLINTPDGILYTQKADGTVKAINPLLGQAPQSMTIEILTPSTSYNSFVVIQGAQVGMNVVASLGCAPNYFPDEYEMEPMAVYAQVIQTNFVAFTVVCTDTGLLTLGKKVINYYIG